MQRFLADENFPGPSIRLLREAGHDVAAIREDDPSARDSQVVARARLEQRVLPTFDRDYGEMIFHHGLPAPPGVVYLRIDPALTDEPASRVLELLANPDAPIEGNFTVVTEERTRQRRLP